MLRHILVQDFYVCRMFPIYASMALLAAIGLLFVRRTRKTHWGIEDIDQRSREDSFERSVFWAALIWCVVAQWDDFVAFNGWKPITYQDQVFRRLLWRNTTHLSMSKDTLFASGHFATAIIKNRGLNPF